MNKKILALVVLVLMVFFIFFNPDNEKVYSQSPVEEVGGTISEDTTWTKGNLYRVTEDINIASGATLTIEPGTIVKLSGVGNFTVNDGGNLTINGTETNKVTLTSWRDNTIGENVGDGTPPSKANWSGIVVENGGTANIKHMNMKYGGYYNSITSPHGDSITKLSGGILNIENSLVYESARSGIKVIGVGTAIISNTDVENVLENGIDLEYSEATITGGSITNTGEHGIELKQSVAAISEVSIKDSVQFGVFSQDSATTISGASIESSGRSGIWIRATGMYSGEVSSIDNVTFIEDNTSVIWLSPELAGTSVTNCTMPNSAIEIFGGNINREITLNSKHTYYMEHKININFNGKLTIPAGTIIKSKVGENVIGFITVNNGGNLTINGTENDKVTLTSWLDNTIGEDIGDKTDPSKGDWGSIVVRDGGTANINHMDMKYGGHRREGYYPFGDTIVKESGGRLNLENSLIDESASNGIRIEGEGTSLIKNVDVLKSGASGIRLINSSPSIIKSTLKENGIGITISGTSQPIIGGSEANSNTISQNTDFGVNNTTTTTIDATYNWWGHESGANHSTNPEGTGDKVSDYVDFIPFIEELINTTPPNLTAGKVNRISHTEATVKFTSDQEGEYFYEVVEAGGTAPVIDTSGDGIPCDTREQIINITGLFSGPKDIYIVAKDSTGNLSDALMINIPEYVTPDPDPDPDPDLEPDPAPKPKPEPKPAIYHIDKEQYGITGINLSSTINNGISIFRLQSEEIDALIKEAQSKKRTNKGDTIEIKTLIEKAKTLDFIIPQKSFKQIVDETNVGLQISTPIGMVRFDEKALERINKAAEGKDNVEISVGVLDIEKLSKEDRLRVKDRPIYKFSLKVGENIVSDFGEGYGMVTIPYTLKQGENPNALVVYYPSDNGNIKRVRGYFESETSTIRFKTNHFFKTIIGYNPVSFEDVYIDDWYKDAVDFISARGITTGVDSNNYSPKSKLTRGQFIVMIMRAYGIKSEENIEENFVDAGDTYYTNYLAIAKKLGISKGIGNNRFAPNKEITREEMFTLLYNSLKVINELPEGIIEKSLEDFIDKEEVSPWAEESISFLIKSHIINGYNNKLSPKELSNRGEMAQLMYELLRK